jgi:hypothetical protein
MILATTMWDRIDELTGSQRENDLKNNYWKLMIKPGPRLVRFYHTKESAWDIIGQFTGIRQPLQLQIEMVGEGKPLADTAAGLVVFESLKDLVAEIQQLVKRRKTSKYEGEASALVEEELATINGQEQFDAAAIGKMVTDQALRSSSPSTQQDSIFSSLVDPTLSRPDTRSDSTLLQRNKLRGRQKQERFSAPTSANMLMSRSDTQSTNSSLLSPASAQEGVESPPLGFHNKRLAATITALRHAKDIADAALVPDISGVTSSALTIAETIAVKST